MSKRYIYIYIIYLMISCDNQGYNPVNKENNYSYLSFSASLNRKINDYDNYIINKYIKKNNLLFININGVYISKKNNYNNLQKGDVIEYKYRIYNLDNKLLYDYNEVGDRKIKYGYSYLMPGLQNIIQYIPIKEKIYIIIPSLLVRDKLRDNSEIKDEIIKIEFELIKLLKKNTF